MTIKKTLVSLLLVLCCLFFLVGCGGEATDIQVDSTEQSVEGAYSGDLAFYAELPDKSVCVDKTIEVTGEFTEKFLSNYYIGSSSDEFYIFFFFDEKTDEVKQLAEGDIITVRGKCVDSEDDKMQLSACELVSVIKNEQTQVLPPTPEPTQEEAVAPQPTPPPTQKPTATPDLTPEPTPENSTFSIHFIDVGQADAALVECDGHYMLIDGGNVEDSNLIYSVLKKADVKKLDIIVGTHAHEDHVGGLPGALNYTKADLTLCATKSYDSNAFRAFKQYANKNGGGIVIPSVGDTYSLGSASVKILGVNGGEDTNDTSIVLMITYGQTKFLFTGDAEREAEQTILKSGADLSATVLKVGHHGSDTSTTYPFLREIMPQYAVISVGEGNTYGHPTDDTLSRLRDADVKAYRTDMQGDIKCTSDGKTVSFSVARNADVDTLASVTKEEPTPTPTPTPKPTPTPVPVRPIDELKEIVEESCKNYNTRTVQVLGGTLTYDVVSTTEVQLYYDVKNPVSTDEEYLVDDVMDQILDYVIDDIIESGFPEEVTAYITANYFPAEDSEPNVPYFILNTDSKKFHDPDCGSAAKISSANKDYYTGSAEDLIKMGYSPCGNCDPYEAQEPDPTPEPTQSETMVWIPKSGSKYHSYSGCSNMKNPTQVTKTEAISRGYTACKKCW